MPRTTPLGFYSITHISMADAKLLDFASPRLGNLGYNWALIGDTGYGFLLWVGTEGLSDDDIAATREIGFSPEFVAILQDAAQQGCQYVMLDRDEEHDEARPTFPEWGGAAA